MTRKNRASTRLGYAMVLLAGLVLGGCTRALPPDDSGVPIPSRRLPSPSPLPVFRFAVLGDWGAGTEAQAEVAATMCRARRDEPFDVVVTTGDNFYNPDGRATEENFSPSRCLTEHPGHSWRATWGNHDLAGDSTLVTLGSDRTYQWSAASADFFMLDSNRARDAAQTAWLSDALSKSSAALKIAVFHHPPFTESLHPPDQAVRESWVPLFVAHEVTLVLNGHSHAYERAVVDGVNYVVSGGGGAPIYPCVRDETLVQVCESMYHFLLIEVSGSKVEIRVITRDGSEADRFTLTASKDVHSPS